MKVVRDRGELRPLARRVQERARRCSARNSTSLPARSSSMKVTPPDVPTPGMAGGGKANACASGSMRSFAVELAHDRPSRCVPRRVALVPRLQGDEEEGVVGRVDAAEQAEADDRVVGLHARRVLQDRLDLLADRVRALQRRGVGQLHVHVEVALVLLGQEARRQARCRRSRRAPAMPASSSIASAGLADQAPAPADVAVGGAAEARG